ncbi:MAG: peptide ABC transporter substrate-binding protein [Verrucomicrobia bacterium]|nr:peptide ABC transporter substrate-binding protein [Verrucomicrobiota bacterium]
MSIQSEICSLDPSVAIDVPSIFPQRMLFEGLVIADLSGNIRPAIAERYEISDDLKTFTFYLRPSVWSNGDPVTAYDFEYAWKKIINPQTTTLGAHNFYYIKNAKQASQGEVSIDEVGIKVLDTYTLKVELEHPTPYFLEIVAIPSFFPINSKIDKVNPKWSNLQGDQFVCNGPFVLEKHRIDNEILVRKNPNYWDAENVKLPGISIAIIKDSSTQLSMFEKGELDWLGQPLAKIPLDAIETLKKENKVTFINTLGLYWYYFNTESFPFQNKKMRQAFAYAINRDVIVKHVLQCNESPAFALLSSRLTGQKSPYFEDNNRKLAIRLFNEALAEMEILKDQLPEITINYSAAPINQRLAEALQQQWNQVFGIDIVLEQQEWKVHFERLRVGNFQVGGCGWQSWLRDPIYTMQAFRYKTDGINISHWENPNYQQLLDLAEQEIDLNRRKELFKKAEAILMDDMPVIPIYFMTIAYGKNPKLKDVLITDLYEIDFRWAYFEP